MRTIKEVKHDGCIWSNCGAQMLMNAGVPNDVIVNAVVHAIGEEIDDAVATIYIKFERFATEYELREAEAAAFKQVGYQGEVPVQVAAYAAPAGKTPQEACDIILAEAEKLRGALAQLGVLRMRKYEVSNAATLEEAEQAANAILGEIAQISQALQ